MNRIHDWFTGLSDQWRATLRTAWQSIVGGVLTLLLVLFASATDWLNGGNVDLVQELSNAGRVLGITVMSAATSLVTYYMNRGDKGATYEEN